MAKEFDLQSLLSQWATIESQRCRQQEGGGIAVFIAGEWTPVSTDRWRHGLIIAAVLEACHHQQIYCQIEYTPRYEDEPPTIQVGCTQGAFLWDEGENVLEMIPAFLLTEYLEHLQAKLSAVEA